MTHENDKLSQDLEGEAELMMITCMGCGELRNVQVGATQDEFLALERKGDVLRGTLLCPKCETQTALVLTNGHLTFIQAKDMYPALDNIVAANSKEMFSEAIKCFHGGSYRGVVGMCRSALEEALDKKNVQGANLGEKIENARKHKTAPSGKPNGFLEDDWVARSHGARLTGRNVLHRMEQISLAQALLALAATADLVNYIARQPAMP